jgi:hypothetical protein
MRMKARMNLTLSPPAIARGTRAAAARDLSLSQLVEKHLLAIPELDEPEEFWEGPALKPVVPAGDERAEYLQRKHGHDRID